MRDSEFIAQLLLLIEEAPKSYSQDDLDAAFSSRDPEWEKMGDTVGEYRETIQKIDEIVRSDDSGDLARTRLKNQADFYSLVGAICNLSRSGHQPTSLEAFVRLNHFIEVVEEEQRRNAFAPALAYFNASRAASNDAGPRQTRINTLVEILSGNIFGIKFEIQIRTAFEHAWIVSTHPLTYKSDRIDWRRFRLAAQIKSATEQLDLSIIQFEQLAAAISESPWPELNEKQQVVDLIEKLNNDRIIPSEASPKDMTRFAENLISMIRASKKKIRLEDALSELDVRLRGFTEESFPRSASLLQICMGALCQSGVLSGPLQKYSCHVTEQLVQLFPEVRSLTPVFRYDKK